MDATSATSMATPEIDDRSRTPDLHTPQSNSPAPPASEAAQPSFTASNVPAPTEPTSPADSVSDNPKSLAMQQQSAPASDAANESTNGVAPYGTRSRNRTTARVNYAEEPDIDVDTELPRSRNVNGSKRIYSSESASLSPAIDEDRLSPPSAIKPSALPANAVPASHHHSSSKIPGTSTFSAVPGAGTGAVHSKKRKAAGNHGHSQVVATAPTQPSAKKPKPLHIHYGARESNMMTFDDSGARLKNGSLVADDGTSLSVNEHVYLVCEPPGDPYYLGRIMEFLHVKSDDSKSPIDRLRINWFYRPRDLQRYNADSRLVYMTMHSDVCPITSLRGKCNIKHRSEIDDVDEYRKNKDFFWWNQLFDRFIRRWYECIPTKQIINVPEKVKRALDENWKFVAVEMGRVKELTSAVKLCKRCSQYCASQDSVECALCHNTWHLTCVRPPIAKKPSRGFAWSCAACARAQEKKLQERHTPAVGEATHEAEEEEIPEEEEEEAGTLDSTRAPSPDASGTAVDDHPGTQAEIAVAKMWPVRYLGIHCRVEDALQYDDRAIYPRASSRLGPRHQANVNVWHGHPVEFVKPAEIKKRYVKSSSHKKDAKLSKETVAAIEADRDLKAKRPKWVMDEPAGYVHRGEQRPNNDSKNTAQLRFSMNAHSSRGEDDGPVPPEPENREEVVDNYMKRARQTAKDVGVKEYSTNFLDKALQLLVENKYDQESALQQLKKVNRIKDLKEPELTKDELKKFEDGVAKFGSEHRLVRLHMKTSRPLSEIIRFYYMWKKTPKGREIWGSFDGRKGVRKRMETDAQAKLVDDVADSHDDSAFDGEKAMRQRRGFQCKFCKTHRSRQWRRAPGVAPGSMVLADPKGSNKDKSNQLVVGLCQRCAMLWRKYAVRWENLEEVQKKLNQTSSGRAWKRKYDEELLNELAVANDTGKHSSPELSDTSLVDGASAQDQPRKKSKTAAEKDAATMASVTKPPKEKPAPPPRPPTPPLVPEPPRFKDLWCAVCYEMLGPDTKYRCSSCAMTVHRNCYGITEQRNMDRWICDTCQNDRNPVASTEYICRLCPIYRTEQDLVAPPKQSHKKKTDRERDKERQEKELADKLRADYKREQQKTGRPIEPREPLKQTHQNNWVHITCATWMPELKFSNAKALEKVEGFNSIPLLRFEQQCKVCATNRGACISCYKCHSTFHVECAHQHGYWFSFDVQPVKGSRKDAVTSVTLKGETGNVTPVAWCDTCIKGKDFKTGRIHSIHDPEEESDTGNTTNALQVYVQNFKQADLTLTGTVRKASLVHQSAKALPQPPTTSHQDRRVSTATTRGARHSIGGRSVSEAINVKSEDVDGITESPRSTSPIIQSDRCCASCNINVSPKWWKADLVPKVDGVADSTARDTRMVNGVHEVGGTVDRAQEGKAEAMATTATAALIDSGAVRRPEEYLCHKCHLRRKRGEPTPPPPEVKPLEPLPDPFADQAPPPPPPILQDHFSWITQPTGGAAVGPPPLSTPGWMLAQPPHPQGPHALANGNGPGLGPANYPGPGRHPYAHPLASPHHIQQVNGHAPPPLHITNGIPSHPHGRPPPLQPPTTTSSNAPAANHSQQSPPSLPSANGVHGNSPHSFSLHSPQRATQSPFGLPPHGYVPASTVPAGASPHGGRRPSTPGQSASVNGAAGQGASASPNLRNLLH